MAESTTEGKDEKKEGKPVAAVSNGLSMKMVIIIGLGTLLLGLGGAFAVLKLGGQNQAPAVAEAHGGGQASGQTSGHGGETGHGGEAPKAAGEKGAPVSIFDLDPFIVNLADADVRYLKLTVKLDLDRSETRDEIAARLPQVRDAILILLTSKDAASIRSTQGKFQLRDEIVNRVNSTLPKNGVRTAYFTEFVVQ
ncbi:MAG: flagellar basal body-associated FliL family protein [Nitrospirota bacterium]|nr:flagellar basal body-associated FliL family protein [Nitrospirota bacterium]MDE3119987.1 flagellar basal body-associated FliL family protein [Nitrospirota bacterium]MDE3241084.1 flagellar basal body-associated FliL family protein [Nitrospirota bacterium]